MAGERLIVDEVAAFVKRFVFLQHECMYRLVALWIIHTHLHDIFQYTPYLFIHSPVKECGKAGGSKRTLSHLTRTRHSAGLRVSHGWRVCGQALRLSLFICDKNRMR